MTHITRFTELTRLLKRPQLGPMTASDSAIPHRPGP